MNDNIISDGEIVGRSVRPCIRPSVCPSLCLSLSLLTHECMSDNIISRRGISVRCFYRDDFSAWNRKSNLIYQRVIRPVLLTWDPVSFWETLDKDHKDSNSFSSCRAKGCEYIYTILTLGLTAWYFSDWMCHEIKIVNTAWPIERYKSMTIRWGSRWGLSISDFNDWLLKTLCFIDHQFLGL